MLYDYIKMYLSWGNGVKLSPDNSTFGKGGGRDAAKLRLLFYDSLLLRIVKIRVQFLHYSSNYGILLHQSTNIVLILRVTATVTDCVIELTRAVNFRKNRN